MLGEEQVSPRDKLSVDGSNSSLGRGISSGCYISLTPGRVWLPHSPPEPTNPHTDPEAGTSVSLLDGWG